MVTPPGLVGRRAEVTAIDDLIANVRQGSSGVLVVRGDVGMGKTALVEYAAASAPDFQVARTVGIESEMELGFAGLHQLVRGFEKRLDQLPPPQRDALRCGFGIIQAPRPDRFLVGLATLTLLAEAATERPVLCLVDDAQWLDSVSAEVLGFVARRLLADRIAIVFAARSEGAEVAALRGLPTLNLRGVTPAEAHELLSSSVRGPIDAHVADRIVETAAGNPMVILEVASDLTAAQLEGKARLPEPLPVSAHLQEIFQRRVESLSASARLMLLLAAADPSSDALLLMRAAERLGLGARAVDELEQQRLLRVDTRVEFRHPVIRSAAYHGAPHRRHKQVHEALAAASDPATDPDRRAWHRAAAILGQDDEVATELETAADRARARGGMGAAAALLERSAELTSDSRQRADRLLTAAETELSAGDVAKTEALLTLVGPQVAGTRANARSTRLQAMIDYARGRLGDVPSLLVRAARAFAPIDTTQATQTLLEGIQAAVYSGRFAGDWDAGSVAMVARDLTPSRGDETSIADALLAGFTSLYVDSRASATPHFRAALESLQDDGQPTLDRLRWFMLGCLAASEMWDDRAQHALAKQWVALARETGALIALPVALNYLGWYEVMEGRPRAAAGVLVEGSEIAKATGNAGIVGDSGAGILLRLVWLGEEAAARAAAEAMLQDGMQRRQGAGVTHAKSALTVLELSLRNYEAAFGCGRDVFEEDLLYLGSLVLPDLVEAAVRAGQPGVAKTAVERLRERAAAGGSDWALGVLARAEALVAADDEAEAFYESSLRHLEQSRIAPDLARSHLVFGEWLRRQGRRKDARGHLREAHEAFESMGASLFAERARIELNATGEHARKRGYDNLDRLTPQEAQIGRLAGEGARNQEIAAQLFISPATVEYHLTKVFRKLGVSSRTQLARLASTDPIAVGN